MQPPADKHVEKVIEEVQQRLNTLVNQRAAIVRKISTIRQTIVGLTSLLGEGLLGEELSSVLGPRRKGLTEACRLVLMNSSRPLGAWEVC